MTLRNAPIALLGAIACLCGATSVSLADVRPLTLYQKVARATLVVKVRAQSDSTRRPIMDVLEIYKGFYPASTLTIVPFAQDYANPKPWLRREVFRKGEESILFLKPFDKDEDTAFNDPDESSSGPGPQNSDEDASAESLFVLLNADQGKFAVPVEGAEAVTGAIRRIAGILAMGQSDVQSDALRGLLQDKNPYLIEAGLDEVSRYDLARQEDVPHLLDILASPRDEFRRDALHILGQIAAAARAARGELRERRDILARVVDRALKDLSAPVRTEAVRTLERMRGDGVVAILDAVRSGDSDQNVRYAAGVALISIRESESH